MGWRDELATLLGWAHRNNTPFRPETFIGFVSQCSDEHRIALARELLPEGFVVARDVAHLNCAGEFLVADTEHMRRAMLAARMSGWNACRAAMMREATADDMQGIKAQILNRRAGEGE